MNAVKKKNFSEELLRRRKRVFRRLGRNALVCLFSAPQQVYSNDVHHPYRQDSNFAYLSGLTEDEMIMVLAPNHPLGDYILFCTPSNQHTTIWEGKRIGIDRAPRLSGASKAFSITEFENIFPKLIDSYQKLYCNTSNSQNLLRLTQLCTQAKIAQRGCVVPSIFTDIQLLLDDLRLKKSPLEIQLMQKSVDIALTAHRRAWQICRPGLYEYEINAEIMQTFHRHNARPSYPAIVASGANACVLHYTDNQKKLKSGELLLIDAGAEYQMYASDITRTIPVSGHFKPFQHELYEIVLEAQLAAISKAIVGNTWHDLNQAVIKVLTQGLINTGILKGRLPKLIKDRAYWDFYMHSCGHWLGMDVHDVSSISKDKHGHPQRFEAGMTLTVEPGLYLRDGHNIPKHLRNTGIRIEDDVLISRSGPKVLSSALPKTVDEIEAAF